MSQHQSAHLRQVLNSMFPLEYLELHHSPPRSVCSLLSLKCWPQNQSPCFDSWDTEISIHRRLEVSTEPSSRASLITLTERLDSSLIHHQAKQMGLCPIRRSIYDQCFDEIIRQVTVSCIEQGMLLLRIRDELRMTINCYRKTCESGIKFGLNKAIEAELEVGQVKSQILELDSIREKVEENRELEERVDRLKFKNQQDSMARMQIYYKEELTKRDQIIEQQRNIIKALSRECSLGIKSPLNSNVLGNNHTNSVNRDVDE